MYLFWDIMCETIIIVRDNDEIFGVESVILCIFKENQMERIELFIKENIPEAITWEIAHCDKAIINNPDNARLNGLYEAFLISYKDKYKAVYYDYILCKDSKVIGTNSKLKDKIDSSMIHGIKHNDIDIYEYIEKNNIDEAAIAILMCKLVANNDINKNISIREYVTVPEEICGNDFSKQEYEKDFKEDDVDYKDMVKEIYEYVKLNNELLSKLVEK